MRTPATSRNTRKKKKTSCVVVGAVSVIPVVVLGWFHADFGGYGLEAEETLGLHRWIGTVAGVWTIGVLVLSERDWRRQRRSWAFRLALGIGTVLILAAAHFGGTLVHGEEFFNG